MSSVGVVNQNIEMSTVDVTKKYGISSNVNKSRSNDFVIINKKFTSFRLSHKSQLWGVCVPFSSCFSTTYWFSLVSQRNGEAYIRKKCLGVEIDSTVLLNGCWIGIKFKFYYFDKTVEDFEMKTLNKHQRAVIASLMFLSKLIRSFAMFAADNANRFYF